MASRGGRRAAGKLESEVLTALHAADGPLTPAEVQRALGDTLALIEQRNESLGN